MLAWVHQSLAGEREVLVQLFGDDSVGGAAATSAETPSIAELLDRIFESICKPLKVRKGEEGAPPVLWGAPPHPT